MSEQKISSIEYDFTQHYDRQPQIKRTTSNAITGQVWYDQDGVAVRLVLPLSVY